LSPPLRTTAPFPLPLHDALPISSISISCPSPPRKRPGPPESTRSRFAQTRNGVSPSITSIEAQVLFVGNGVHASPSLTGRAPIRSEEHTSELQSRVDLVCRLLLE